MAMCEFSVKKSTCLLQFPPFACGECQQLLLQISQTLSVLLKTLFQFKNLFLLSQLCLRLICVIIQQLQMIACIIRTVLRYDWRSILLASVLHNALHHLIKHKPSLSFEREQRKFIHSAPNLTIIQVKFVLIEEEFLEFGFLCGIISLIHNHTILHHDILRPFILLFTLRRLIVNRLIRCIPPPRCTSFQLFPLGLPRFIPSKSLLVPLPHIIHIDMQPHQPTQTLLP
mmetsp:Transcript_10570/g.39353  ORF Transcript_10570/g.39353 Transcript_10570/m.39353 type:complete len:228 (-) Transcript_10570:809-1492(-)